MQFATKAVSTQLSNIVSKILVRFSPVPVVVFNVCHSVAVNNRNWIKFACNRFRTAPNRRTDSVIFVLQN